MFIALVQHCPMYYNMIGVERLYILMPFRAMQFKQMKIRYTLLYVDIGPGFKREKDAENRKRTCIYSPHFERMPQHFQHQQQKIIIKLGKKKPYTPNALTHKHIRHIQLPSQRNISRAHIN